MADYDFDLFVIGAGSGGVRAARLAAMSGAKVAVAEEYRVGGTCVIRGCVPKKFMVYASEVTSQLKTAKGYGWTVEGAKFDWKSFLHDKDVEIARLSGIYVTNLQKAGAHLLHGRAQIVDAHTVEVLPKEDSKDAGTYTAKKILVATGGRPVRPEFPGAEFGITSDEAFHLPKLPKSIMIVGGGYIAVEFAGIFNGLGVQTTLLYRGANILRGFDDDVRSHLADELEKRGIKVVLGCAHKSIEKGEDGTLLSTLSNDLTFETETVMFATGRGPYVEGLGLEKAGVKLNERGAIAVDDYSKTNVPSIWAVGDVTDRINLTPVAIREGAAFSQTEFYDNPTSFDHDMVASAVFSQPPVGSVGMTEAEARHAFGTVDIYRAVFRPMKITFYGGQERCLVKLVVKQDDQKVVGVHVVGPDSPEIIQMAAIAVKMGVTKPQWDSTCAVHPTLAEELVTLREKYVPVEVGGVG
ncbi:MULTISPECIES: glutathione-disulfide reductase [unclassified Caulobacter]|uniref:glutathione-disulfide reductase n=1 Tax=unclassified Caulobacter TaxID=2648921 RepID=UPI0006F8E553|nr:MULTISPECIES: glutathione-disulfide reductase [unclassified Caulobacter]KQV58463.1 glutathione reductase [Caulobacter sp. Root342]KQV69029.1 glutathione reductase [Caulobacter sp. Root343]